MKAMYMGLVSAFFLLLANNSFAQAGPCSNSTLRGSYGFITVTAAGRNLIGVFVYSGDGNVNLHARTVDAQAVKNDINTTGTYVVGPQCVGTITIPTGNSDPTATKMTFVIVSGGSEIDTIVSSGGNQRPFVQKKQ